MSQVSLKTVVIFFFVFNFNKAKALVFDMAPLEFSNRAACADLSTKPTRSVFLQIDAFNAGKAGFAGGLIAQKNNLLLDPGLSAQQAVKDFRIWSTHLTVEIAEALLKGRLPLLSPDGSAPDLYRKSVESCLNKKEFLSCPAMNDLLADLWARSKMSEPHWEQLGFQPNDFTPIELRKNTAIGCHIIRKFSAFHSHLKSQTVEDSIIAQIAMDSFKPENHLDSCYSDTEGKDPRFTTVQIDIARMLNEEDWQSMGFPFWHSVKLFLSWAWRYAPEYRQEFGQFDQIFASLAFEDSIMLIPNGCRSIEMPRCDSTGLASDTMRAAKFLGMTHPAIGEVRPRPIDTLFTGKVQPVNSDILALSKATDASAWARDFKEKLSGLRFEMMTKLNTGLSKLRVITSLVDAKTLAQDITSILEDPDYDKIETYLACLEYRLAKNELYNDIDAEIQTLNQATELKSILLNDSGKDIQAFVQYYQTLTDTMGPFCIALEKKGRVPATILNLFKSLHEWAFDLLRPNERKSYQPQCSLNPNLPACPKNTDKKYLVAHPRQNLNIENEFTICKTSLECARTILESLVSVISVRRYAHAFLPLEDVIRSPHLFNTYAAPTACKLYDPWSKQRNSWKLFIADLGSALLSGASCGAFNFQVLNLPKDEVIGYKEILENNQFTYAPKTEAEPLKYIAGLDYTFLPGFNCGAAVTNLILADQRNYILPGFFSTFRVNKCQGGTDVDYVINKHPLLYSAMNTILQEKDTEVVKTCFRCSIEFTALAKYSCFAAPVIGMPLAAGVGIFQGLMRLISNLSDDDNIPKSSQLNIDQISQSFADMKKITPTCHKQLKRGVTCH